MLFRGWLPRNNIDCEFVIYDWCGEVVNPFRSAPGLIRLTEADSADPNRVGSTRSTDCWSDADAVETATSPSLRTS